MIQLLRGKVEKLLFTRTLLGGAVFDLYRIFHLYFLIAAFHRGIRDMLYTAFIAN